MFTFELTSVFIHHAIYFVKYLYKVNNKDVGTLFMKTRSILFIVNFEQIFVLWVLRNMLKIIKES